MRGNTTGLVALVVSGVCLVPWVANRLEDRCYRDVPEEWTYSNGYDYANGTWTYQGTVVGYMNAEDNTEVNVCVEGDRT